jgi:uncharacterized membrane protein YdbT with pleckstrin-like domain
LASAKESIVNDLIVQPTLRFIKTGAVIAALIFIGLEILYLTQWRENMDAWVMVLPPLILLWPLTRYLRWRSEKIVVSGDRLRHQSGIMSKDIRTIEITKLQYVRVHQSFLQRVFGVGDIGFETAGQGTWQGLHNVEHPQQIADEIMNRAGKGTSA